MYFTSGSAHKQIRPIGRSEQKYFTQDNSYMVQRTIIQAACDGHVSLAHFDSTGYGNLTVITDSEDGRHYYAYQNAFSVKVDDEINLERLICCMGSTGNVMSSTYSDRTHLNCGYHPAGYSRDNGYGGFIDPMLYFEKKKLSEMTVPNSWDG